MSVIGAKAKSGWLAMLAVVTTTSVLVGLAPAADAASNDILMVAATSGVGGDDRIVADALRAGGFDVEVVADEDVEAADANGKDAIFIAPTTVASEVGSLFTDSVVPVVNSEFMLHDDLGLTRAGSANQGEQGSFKSIKIVGKAHPIAVAADVSGLAEVYTTQSKVTWGKPAPSADVIASQQGNQARPVLFTYEKGAELRSGFAAPSRRAAIFLTGHSDSRMSQTGKDLLIATLDWAIEQPSDEPRIDVLMVTATNNGAPDDQKVANGLRANGLSVRFVADEAVTVAEAKSADVVLISTTAAANQIGKKLTPVDVPLVAYDHQLFDDLGLTKNGNGKRRELRTDLSVDLVSRSHPIAEAFGTSSSVTVFEQSAKMSLGKPAASAEIVARPSGNDVWAALFTYEAGAQLASGDPAPARRAAAFPTLLSDRHLTADGLKLLAETVKWAAGTPTAPPSTGWLDVSRSFRMPLTVSAGKHDRIDRPAVVEINFGTALKRRNAGDFDPRSLHLIEVDENGSPIATSVAIQFEPTKTIADKGFVVLDVPGLLEAGSSRNYQLYFDTVQAAVRPVPVQPQVSLNRDGADEELATIDITTPAGVYRFDTEGGGFSSIEDVDGNDWISWSTAPGGSGQYRGLPNMINPEDQFHPGRTGVTTEVVADGPLRTSFTVSAPGGWQGRWNIYPTFAEFELEAVGHKYWFLYEGTPGGTFEPDIDLYVRSDGSVYPASEQVFTDIVGAEWSMVVDPRVGRSFFISHDKNDQLVDSFSPFGDAEMALMSFGRRTLRPTKLLSKVPDRFTIGFVDAISASEAAPVVETSRFAVDVVDGPVERQ